MEIRSSKTEEEKQKDLFFMKTPVIVITVILSFFVLQTFNALEITILYYSCYVFLDLAIMGLLISCGLRKLVALGPIAANVILGIIFRDVVLTVNLGAALAACLLAVLFTLEKLDRCGFSIFVLSCAIFWILRGTDNKLIVISLVVGGVVSVGKILKKRVSFNYVVILGMLLLVFMPVNAGPIKWTYIKNVFYKVESVINIVVSEISYRAGEVFDINGSYSGYSDVNNLGGAVKDSSIEEISFNREKKDTTLYLKGAAFLTFTNEGLDTKEKFDEDYNQWFVGYINALMNADACPEEVQCFSSVESAGVIYKYISTEDIIAPFNTLKISDRALKNTGEKHKKGFGYEVNYLVIDYGSPYFVDIIEKCSSLNEEFYSYDEVSEYVRSIYHINMFDIMSRERYEELVNEFKVEGSNEELSKYLDTTMSTKRIADLSNELTSGLDNNYQKAKVIEAYLRDLTYDKNVDLRDENNYIESFLFDEKSGYCVHFASAMVMMLRECGIPARYVNGYLYASEESVVLSNNAHAWVEAYMPGYGWMSFEPTASKKNAEQLTWGKKVKEKNEKVEKGEAATDWENFYQSQLGENYYDRVEENSADSHPKEEKNSLGIGIVRYILHYLLIIFIAVFLLYLLYRFARGIWYKNLPENKKLGLKVKKICGKIEAGLSKEELKQLSKNDASLYDYLDYVDEEKISESIEDIRKLFDSYYVSRFRVR